MCAFSAVAELLVLVSVSVCHFCVFFCVFFLISRQLRWAWTFTDISPAAVNSKFANKVRIFVHIRDYKAFSIVCVQIVQ